MNMKYLPELKHSINMYLRFGFDVEKLGRFAIKFIDFLEDDDELRVDLEMARMSWQIVIEIITTLYETTNAETKTEHLDTIMKALGAVSTSKNADLPDEYISGKNAAIAVMLKMTDELINKPDLFDINGKLYD